MIYPAITTDASIVLANETQEIPMLLITAITDPLLQII